MIELRRSSATKAAAITAAAAPLLSRLTDFFVSRFYFNSATAAQPQPDDDYYYNYKLPRRYGPIPMSESEAFVPTNPVQWSFIGNPSAKRHVFARRISKLLQVPHISISTLVCQDLNPRSSLYKQVYSPLLSVHISFAFFLCFLVWSCKLDLGLRVFWSFKCIFESRGK